MGSRVLIVGVFVSGKQKLSHGLSSYKFYLSKKKKKSSYKFYFFFV